MNNSTNNTENPEEEGELPKLPFKRLKHALKQVVEVAIPFHVQLLKQQSENIEVFKEENRDLELRAEQVKATKTVQLLKADLYELERLNIQVREEDSDLFHNFIKNSTKDAIEILSLFMDLHSDIFSPIPEAEPDTNLQKVFQPLVCSYDEQCFDNEGIAIAEGVTELEQKQAQLELPAVKSKFESLNFIHNELLEINSLIKQFSRFIFRQRESVDTIQDNIQQTNENVLIGTEFLRKASDYKAATFPIAGAVIGGLILGPAGALAGFKIFGSIACVAGGSVIGYGAGVKLKKKQQAANEFEMKALTYSSKSQSRSSPDLSVEHIDDQK